MEHAAWAIIVAGILIFLAHLFAEVFERTRVPDVLPLVLLGLLLGPVTGLVSPEALGRLGSVFTTASLVIILFEGGLDLRVATLARSVAGAVRLSVINVAATTLAIGGLSYWWFGMDYLDAATLGTIAGATSSAVVVPLVARLRLTRQTRTTLVVEAALSDVICIILVLGYIEAARVASPIGTAIVGRMLSSLLLAVLLGLAAGILWSALLERVRHLQTSMFTTPAFVFVVFGITELLGFSGAIASLTFGLALGNTDSLQMFFRRLHLDIPVGHLLETERALFAEMVFVVKSFFFVFIGISMRLGEQLGVGLGFVGVTMVLRVLVVLASLRRSLTVYDASIASVMIPKGLASAVLASLAVEARLPQGETIRDVSYAMILFSIGATAVLAFLAERGYLAPAFRLMLPGEHAEKLVAEPAMDGAGNVSAEEASGTPLAPPTHRPSDMTRD